MENSGVWTDFYFSPFQITLPSPAKLYMWSMYSSLFNIPQVPLVASVPLTPTLDTSCWLSKYLWKVRPSPATSPQSSLSLTKFSRSSHSPPRSAAACSVLSPQPWASHYECPFFSFSCPNTTRASKIISLNLDWFFPCPRGGCGQSHVQDVGPSYTFSLESTSEPSDSRIEKWYQWPSKKTLLSFLLCISLIQPWIRSLALPWPDALPLFLSL